MLETPIDERLHIVPEDLEDEVRQQRTVIFFDWDDMLFPHKDLRKYLKTVKLPDTVVKQLNRHERAVSILLKKAITLAEVYIVTNSEKGWVAHTAMKFMPGILPLVANITYACDKYKDVTYLKSKVLYCLCLINVGACVP